ncbi:MAG: aminopeptidase N [Hyphomicrobiaceae bacterium]
MLRRNPESGSESIPLELDGRELKLVSVTLDGVDLGPNEYELYDEGLRIPDVPLIFHLKTVVRIHPSTNTSLEGLYVSSGNFCTQCEPQGFRKITFYPDRPDVMTTFSVSIVADIVRFPVLLSNGNPGPLEVLGDGRHRARWDDPFPKPSYLFALVAGDLRPHSDVFQTMSGRTVPLNIWVEPRNIDKCEHAMRSLVHSMRWDEEVYGREYDLEVFNIVAVDDFNMGAMENKGLNVFNSKYVLADPTTATDDDYIGIEGVVAHEYFHNWTGNRITCRDWFQLSLKEGLTVFRDQEFSADRSARATKRIGDVQVLRTYQFPEDAGPMAHPIRPESYIEINNFYTSTIYNKGAEVVRMLRGLLGSDGFRAGTDLYFKRYDGCAVTTEEFVRAMEDACSVDLSQFRRWYEQAGTPVVSAKSSWDAAQGTLDLHFEQRLDPTAGQPEKAPMHIPVAVGLVGREGRDLPMQLDGETQESSAPTRILELKETSQSFRFVGLTEEPVPSLLRGFSAPVRLESDLDEAGLAHLAAWDSDPFNRWEAGQRGALAVLLRLVDDAKAGRELVVPTSLVQVFERTVDDTAMDRSLLAKALVLPAEGYVGDHLGEVDPELVHRVRDHVRGEIARLLEPKFAKLYEVHRSRDAYSTDPDAIGRRSVAAVALAYLCRTGGEHGLGCATAQFRDADNMTDRLAALTVLADRPGPEREEALLSFFENWKEEPLVLDKWFTVQAISTLPDVLAEVKSLAKHPMFSLKNPNRVRSLLGAFAAGNPVGFHAADGSGYTFVADQVLGLDVLNAQVAARMAGAFTRWRRYEPRRRELMRAELERMADARPSKDVYEILIKSLARQK